MGKSELAAQTYPFWYSSVCDTSDPFSTGSPQNPLHIHSLSTSYRPQGCAIMPMLVGCFRNLTNHYVQIAPTKAVLPDSHFSHRYAFAHGRVVAGREPLL